MRLWLDLTWKAGALAVMTSLLLLPACSREREKRAERVQSAIRAAQAASAGVSATTAAEARAAAADPTHKALTQAFDKLQTAYPYRLTDKSTVTTSIGLTIQPMVRISEHAAPDRARVRWRQGEYAGEIIALGDKAYAHVNGSGTWHTADRKAAKPSADLKKMLAAGVTDVRKAGRATINGVPSSVYTFRFQWRAFGMIFDGTGRAWIRTDDGLPQRAEMETRTGLFDTKSEVAYEYGVPIEITAPAL